MSNGNGSPQWRMLAAILAIVGMAGSGASYMSVLQGQISSAKEAIQALRDQLSEHRRDQLAWEGEEHQLDVRVQNQIQDMFKYLHAEVVDVQKECREYYKATTRGPP